MSCITYSGNVLCSLFRFLIINMVGFGFGMGPVLVHPISNITNVVSEDDWFQAWFPNPSVFISLCLLFLNFICNIISTKLFNLLLWFKQFLIIYPWVFLLVYVC